MDQKTLIANLNTIFCQTNQKDKKYSEVWLSDVDFGGMYNNGKFVLNVKAEHQIDNCNEEIFSIIRLLSEQAPKELENIWRVVVYNPDDSWHCYSDEDVLVYTQSDACH
jgi:hypothetical protein